MWSHLYMGRESKYLCCIFYSGIYFTSLKAVDSYYCYDEPFQTNFSWAWFQIQLSLSSLGQVRTQNRQTGKSRDVFGLRSNIQTQLKLYVLCVVCTIHSYMKGQTGLVDCSVVCVLDKSSYWKILYLESFSCCVGLYKSTKNVYSVELGLLSCFVSSDAVWTCIVDDLVNGWANYVPRNLSSPGDTGCHKKCLKEL